MSKLVTIPIADIDRLLVGLGFEHRLIEGSHHLFTHDASDTTFLVPLGRRGRVPAHVAIGIARLLDERGFRQRHDVEAELLQHATDRPANVTTTPAKRIATRVAS
jgi:predicted RNA binding protein YcfA (HicA-like mRNA interferase family)